MTPADEPEFIRIIVGLSTIKPGKPLTPEGIELYWLAMQGWSIAEFREAAAHLMGAVEFMPNPFHFEQLRKAGQEQAPEAWAQVLEFVRSGEYRYGKSLGGRIDRVVRALGGYEAIGMSPTDKTHFLEKRFAEHWEDMGDAEAVREALPQIAGFQVTGPQRAPLTLPRRV